MTVQELTKNFFNGTSIELSDRERIRYLILNLGKNFGRYEILNEKIIITLNNGKHKPLKYTISKKLLTNEQISFLSNNK